MAGRQNGKRRQGKGGKNPCNYKTVKWKIIIRILKVLKTMCVSINTLMAQLKQKVEER